MRGSSVDDAENGVSKADLLVCPPTKIASVNKTSKETGLSRIQSDPALMDLDERKSSVEKRHAPRTKSDVELNGLPSETGYGISRDISHHVKDRPASRPIAIYLLTLGHHAFQCYACVLIYWKCTWCIAFLLYSFHGCDWVFSTSI